MATAESTGNRWVIGHEWATELLTHGLEGDRLSQSYLFVGPQRVGKTTLALYLARLLNCLAPSSRPCGQCSACQKIVQGLHPDVRVINEGEGSIKIDQIREMQREIALSPYQGQWRVYVLCDFQQATAEAANCLLKTLEEPPPKVVLILTATESEALLPTIVSRCQVLNLRALPAKQIGQALQAYWNVQPDRADLLAKLSRGRMGWAIAASTDDALLRNREKHLLALEQALRLGCAQRIGLAGQLCRNAEALPVLCDSWQSWWRDLLLLKSGDSGALVNVDRERTLQAEVRHCTVHDILDCLHSIRDCADQIEHNVSPCLALEVLFLKLPSFVDGEA
jgi:DNA polymerase-3 subunit delta'